VTFVIVVGQIVRDTPAASMRRRNLYEAMREKAGLPKPQR